MRTLCAVLLVLLAAALGALLPAVAVAQASPVNASYPWVQPWAVGVVAPDVGQWTQPPLSVSIGIRIVPPAGPDASYRWVQPWEIRPGTLPDVGRWAQPPASLPAG